MLHHFDFLGCLGDTVDVRNSLYLLHHVFHCHRLKVTLYCPATKGCMGVYSFVYACVFSMAGVICLLDGITFNCCSASRNRPDVPAPSFLACSFFSFTCFPKCMRHVCLCVCVCMYICGLGEELLCCGGSLCGAGLNFWLYWSSAERLG